MKRIIVKRKGGKKRVTKKRIGKRKTYANKLYPFKRSAGIPTLVGFGGTAFGPNAGQAFTLTADSWQLISGTGSQLSYFSFTAACALNMLPQATEFITLFDQYMIVGCLFQLIPYSTMAHTEDNSVTAQGATSLMCHSVIDYDDDFVPVPSNVGVEALRQYPTYKLQNMFDPKKLGLRRFYRPKMLQTTLDQGGIPQNAVSKGPQWLNSANSNINYLGLKVIMEMFQPQAAFSYNMFMRSSMTLYIRTRNVV